MQGLRLDGTFKVEMQLCFRQRAQEILKGVSR